MMPRSMESQMRAARNQSDSISSLDPPGIFARQRLTLSAYAVKTVYPRDRTLAAWKDRFTTRRGAHGERRRRGHVEKPPSRAAAQSGGRRYAREDSNPQLAGPKPAALIQLSYGRMHPSSTWRPLGPFHEFHVVFLHFVVITITPLAPRMPYIAVEAASFRTSIEATSRGLIPMYPPGPG